MRMRVRGLLASVVGLGLSLSAHAEFAESTLGCTAGIVNGSASGHIRMVIHDTFHGPIIGGTSQGGTGHVRQIPYIPQYPSIPNSPYHLIPTPAYVAPVKPVEVTPIPSVEPKVEPKIEPKIEPKVEPKIEPKIEPKKRVLPKIDNEPVKDPLD